jgi:hypothetical protein
MNRFPSGESLVATDDRSQRWRKIAIDQFGYALNLLLTLTVAAVAYWFALLRDQAFLPSSTAKGWMIASLVALTFAALFGLVCVLNRLLDFRGTAQRASEKPEAPTRDELRWRGRVTWALLYAELIGFSVGMVTIAIALLLTFGSKLR